MIDDLKKENRTIPSMKKSIFENEIQINDLKNSLKDNEERIKILNIEKDDIENKLTVILEKNSGENSVERLRHGMMKYSYELENKKY